MFRWAVTAQPATFARWAPLQYWPDATEPAHYEGAVQHGILVVQRWSTGPGDIDVAWPLPDGQPRGIAEVAASLRSPSAAVMLIRNDLAPTGPAVDTVGTGPAERGRGAVAELPDTTVAWHHLARVLGRPMPYWRYSLRSPELLIDWTPDTATVLAPADPDLDAAPLLRLAAAFDSGHPAHHTLLHLARVALYRSAQSAESELRTMQKALARRPVPAHTTTVTAAETMPVPAADREDLFETTRRAGWLEILARTDTLATQCVAEVLAWDGGKDLPYSQPVDVDPADDAALSPGSRVGRPAALGPPDRGDATRRPRRCRRPAPRSRHRRARRPAR